MISITGYGMITGLGNCISENINGLIEKKNAFFAPAYLKTKHLNFPVSEVKLSNQELKKRLHISNERNFNRTTLLALTAMQEALRFLPDDVFKSRKIAFVNATTVSGMTDVEEYYSDFISEERDGAFMNYISSTGCADCTNNICDFFNLKGFQATISTACSSSSNAVILAAKLIETGEADIVICGGTDAISKFTLNGFNSLKNISDKFNMPFDDNRKGLNLGEGAAYLILESNISAESRKANSKAQLTGYANTNEAYHPTAPSPNGEGALRTMKAALNNANLTPQEIDYISTHGTATLGNDLSEGKAIERLFSSKKNSPPFSSIKSYIGHSLASSGVASMIFACYSLQTGFLPENLRFKTGIKEIKIKPLNDHVLNADINYVLCNSFGFGGNNVSVILRKSLTC